MLSNKKAVHPVVAVSLLLLVTVISVSGFLSWFSSFATEVLVDTEEQSSESGESLKIEALVGEKLYVNSKNNVSIVSVQVDGIDCNIVGNYKGTESLDISSCLSNISSQTPEVIINTGNKLISSYIYVDTEITPPITGLINLWNYTLLTNYNDYMGAEDLDIDSNNNILVTGTTNLQGTGADFFTIKFNPSGTMLWNHTENEASDNGRGIAVNSEDDVIVGGMTTNFGASWNFYGLWFDENKAFNDKISFDGGSTDRMYDIEVDNLDNVIMAGEMYDGSQYDLKILKYNKSLFPIWNRTVDLPVTIRNFRFEVGPNNNYYFSGRFDNGTDDRMFLTKYDAAGTQLWNTTGARNASIDLQDVAIDNSENVYFPAKYAPTQDVVITKFDINGDQIWNYTRVSVHTEGLKSSTIGPNGNIYSIGNTNINGNYDILVLEITPSGTFVNDYVLDFGSSDSGKDLMFDSSGNLIIIGRQDLGSETSYIVSKYNIN